MLEYLGTAYLLLPLLGGGLFHGLCMKYEWVSFLVGAAIILGLQATLLHRLPGVRDIELFGRYKGKLPKKVCIGAVSHRTLQADRAEDVAAGIRRALKFVPADQLVVSSDCGFGRQGCNREIAFYKATAIAQGCNIVRKELGVETTYVPAADPALQIDIVPKSAKG